MYGPDIVFSAPYNETQTDFQAETEQGSLLENPPWFAEWALHALLSKKDRESMIGDMLEDYNTRVVPRFGRPWANIWFWIESIKVAGHQLLSAIKKAGLVAVAVEFYRRFGS